MKNFLIILQIKLWQTGKATCIYICTNTHVSKDKFYNFILSGKKVKEHETRNEIKNVIKLLKPNFM